MTVVGVVLIVTGYLLIVAGFRDESPVDELRRAFGQRVPRRRKTTIPQGLQPPPPVPYSPEGGPLLTSGPTVTGYAQA